MSEQFQIHEIGSHNVEFKSQLTAEEARDLLAEMQRVFVFDRLDWIAETGEATIHFRPGNGMASFADFAKRQKRKRP